MQLILLLSLFSFRAFAQTDHFHYEISHRKTSLVLNWDGKVLQGLDRGMNIGIAYEACSKAQVDDFLAVNKALWKNIPAQKPDSISVVKNGEKLQIAAGSELGGHLLSLRDKIRFLSVLVDKDCKKK
jgi:hypothetical protein